MGPQTDRRDSKINTDELIAAWRKSPGKCSTYVVDPGAGYAVEAARCLYCYDAPCVKACPTAIDIPGFIHRIRSGNIEGSARTILSANIMGGTCGRACPTEVLCEEVCVMNARGEEPIHIGALQRHAVTSRYGRRFAGPSSRLAHVRRTPEFATASAADRRPSKPSGHGGQAPQAFAEKARQALLTCSRRDP